MTQSLQCRCGTIKGLISHPERGNRVLCYCKDCQSFAHYLGHVNEILDERGASDVIQVLPKDIAFTQGIEMLACIRLTEKGLVRWYASCCNTPIGNTLDTPAFSFIGLVHTCLKNKNAFGPIRAWVYTKSAKGDPKPKQAGLGTTSVWFVKTTLKARLNGDYKKSPFFTSTGKPIATPRVLSTEEHARLRNAVATPTR